MGYSLECHVLDHASLKASLGSGDSKLLRRILEAELEIFDANPGVPWRAAMRELIMGERGRQLRQRPVTDDPRPAEILDSSEAMAMVALIRAQGNRIGELVHNSRAGEKFRAVFAPGFTPTPFRHTEQLAKLLHRPICGTAGPIYPDWGGLALAELREMVQHKVAGTDWPADPDQHSWLYTLLDIVNDAVEQRRDLVTLYL